MIEEKLPPKIRNAYLFQALNAVSWQIALGSPMILFARELGAPAAVLGLLAGMAPLTSVLQLFVAPHAERIGYRRLMLSGWSGRVATLIFLTILPLTVGWLSPPVVIGLLLLIMLAFTTLRGIATCAWLPWITAIVPRSLRGYYLSRDRMFISVATVAALTVSGAFLYSHDGMRAYTIVFGLSFLGGAVSLYFLNRVPEPARPAADAPPSPPHHWLHLLRDRPFVRLLFLGVTVQAFVAATATFVTVFVREQVGIPDGVILWLTAGAALVGIVGLALLRNRVDHLGSRPFLQISFGWWVCYEGLWFLIAAGVASQGWWLAALLLLLAGFFGAIYELSVTRLLMNTVSEHTGTAQYFALYSVIISLAAGVSPILWGLLLDALRNVEVTVGAYTLDGFALFFGLQWLLLSVVWVAMSQVKESSAASTRAVLHQFLVTAPSQRLAELTGRGR